MSFARDLALAAALALGLMLPGALGVAWLLVHAGLELPR
jgi:hypothetical protein